MKRINAKLWVMCSIIVAILIGVYVFALAPLSQEVEATPQPTALPVSTPYAAPAMGGEGGVDIQAVSGTISDFWGNATRHANNLWYMQNPDGNAIVQSSGDTLTAYFSDGRDDTILEFLSGSPSELMVLLEQGDPDPDPNSD